MNEWDANPASASFRAVLLLSSATPSRHFWQRQACVSPIAAHVLVSAARGTESHSPVILLDISLKHYKDVFFEGLFYCPNCVLAITIFLFSCISHPNFSFDSDWEYSAILLSL